MIDSVLLWGGFALFVIAALLLDLGVFHRRAHVVQFGEALRWTALWVSMATLFGLGVWYFSGSAKALEFCTGYLIELSLSADNVFVFALIFTYFRVPAQYQHKVLFWGVLGALVMRIAMIGLGVTLIHRFEWILLVFGTLLLVTGAKMVFGKDEQLHPENNPVVRWFTKVVPVSPQYEGSRFYIRRNGRWLATPLMVVLICIEVSDLVFAVDSIPAVFGVTLDPFIIYTSNVFAIMGLRSLYFVLAGVMDKFCYLRIGLGMILALVGIKMLLAKTPYKIETVYALGVVFVILTLSIVASLIRNRRLNSLAPPAVATSVTEETVSGRHS